MIETVEFVPPMPADEAKVLPKREQLELVKPILREHDAQPSRGIGGSPNDPGWEVRETKASKDRWNWIYRALDEGGQHSRGFLGQARREIEAEDSYGHYWEPAGVTVRLIDDGWNRWEVEVSHPRSIRLAEDRYDHGPERKFRTRLFADRWAARCARRYEKYIKRLLAEGLYDAYGYER